VIAKDKDQPVITQMKITTFTQEEYTDYLSRLADPPAATAGTTVNDLGKPAITVDDSTVGGADLANTVIFLKDTGEMILGSTLATNLNSEKATINVTYDKDGFQKGEVRPEMYFNCINKTDAANPITYTNYDDDGEWIAQNINYTVSNNQEMAINTQIHDVVDADCYRDLAELTDIVQDAIDAHTAVSEINSMLESTQYADEESQEYLQDCLEKAEKQMAYADDHLQEVYGRQITNFENYKAKIDLAITNVGTKGDQLSLAENRMSNQKTTFTDLKSKNEDAELSDVTIDYTSAYTAYQASLQAAGKIDDLSLLDYI
jgi:flagellar hook-associated protein 3 FlgL